MTETDRKDIEATSERENKRKLEQNLQEVFILFLIRIKILRINRKNKRMKYYKII